ncbi:MAG TPA: hypothetical protein VFQ96_01230, partial [Microbacteriaceae bacterium]|nr:hypothetical protein [Microbacteriaceae bacterium]
RSVSLEFIDCPDRRVTRAAVDLVAREAEAPGTQVTAILPRRSFSPLLGRLLHDRTADRLARVISHIPQAAATIVPYDVQAHIRSAMPNLPEERITRSIERLASRLTGHDDEDLATATTAAPHAGPGSSPIGVLVPGRKAVVEAYLTELSTDGRREHGHTVLACSLADDTARLSVTFSRAADGLEVGQRLRLTGVPHRDGPGRPLVMADPEFHVVLDPDAADDEADAEDAGTVPSSDARNRDAAGDEKAGTGEDDARH